MKTMGEPFVRCNCPEKVPGCSYHYLDPSSHEGAFVDAWGADKAAQDKRFTDAELAACMWWFIVQFYQSDWGEERREMARQNGIIERFATLPHYDEVTL